MQQLIEFDKLPANLEHPDMHLQIIYYVQTIPTRFIFGFRKASQCVALRKEMNRFNLPQR